jgi:hypothetical protein
MRCVSERWLVTAIVLAFGTLVLLAGCSGDEEASPVTGSKTPSQYATGGPGSELVAVLKSLPVFPQAELEDGQYPTSAPFGDYLSTVFDVKAGTTVDDVTSFYEFNLSSSGWQLEAGPWKDPGQTQTVITTFLNDGGIRLAVLVPTVHKDAPTGVTSVQLILAPNEVDLFPSPVATGIESTPPPTPFVPGPSISVLPTPGPSVEATPVGQEAPARTSPAAATEG